LREHAVQAAGAIERHPAPPRVRRSPRETRNAEVLCGTLLDFEGGAKCRWYEIRDPEERRFFGCEDVLAPPPSMAHNTTDPQ